MNSPILPVQGPLGYPNNAAPAPTGVAFPPELAESNGMPPNAANLDGPPPEVLEEISAAGRTSDELRASGWLVHFAQDEQSGRVTVELRSCEGNMLRELSIAETLDIATGKPLV